MVRGTLCDARNTTGRTLGGTSHVIGSTLILFITITLKSRPSKVFRISFEIAVIEMARLDNLDFDSNFHINNFNLVVLT